MPKQLRYLTKSSSDSQVNTKIQASLLFFVRHSTHYISLKEKQYLSNNLTLAPSYFSLLASFPEKADNQNIILLLAILWNFI